MIHFLDLILILRFSILLKYIFYCTLLFNIFEDFTHTLKSDTLLKWKYLSAVAQYILTALKRGGTASMLTTSFNKPQEFNNYNYINYILRKNNTQNIHNWKIDWNTRNTMQKDYSLLTIKLHIGFKHIRSFYGLLAIHTYSLNTHLKIYLSIYGKKLPWDETLSKW